MPRTSRVSSTRLRIVARAQAELLHAVGELLLDGVGDEPGERVLADDPTRSARSRGRCSRVSRPWTRTWPASVPPVKWGTCRVIGPEQGRLARAGAPDDEGELALVDGSETSRRTGARAPSKGHVTWSSAIAGLGHDRHHLRGARRVPRIRRARASPGAGAAG